MLVQKRRKDYGFFNFSLLTIVFKRHHGSEGVNCFALSVSSDSCLYLSMLLFLNLCLLLTPVSALLYPFLTSVSVLCF